MDKDELKLSREIGILAEGDRVRNVRWEYEGIVHTNHKDGTITVKVDDGQYATGYVDEFRTIRRKRD